MRNCGEGQESCHCEKFRFGGASRRQAFRHAGVAISWNWFASFTMTPYACQLIYGIHPKRGKTDERLLEICKLSLWVVLILSLNLILFISPAFAQYFTIDKFHSDIMIDEDSSLIVKETIDVEFHQPRHGIYREIPFKYRDDFGKVITTPTKVLSVTDESGKPWKYQVTKTGPVINIRIGDARKYVEGRWTYIITYEVENVILFFKDHDELYWNVTGNYWKAPIKEASATASLTTKKKSKNLMAAGYEGSYGSKEECSYETYDNSGKFYTKRSLKMGEGLTVVFGWDKGLVSPPSSWKKFLWAINLSGKLGIFASDFFIPLHGQSVVSKGERSKSQRVCYRDV